jgi:hypothetical protein
LIRALALGTKPDPTYPVEDVSSSFLDRVIVITDT